MTLSPRELQVLRLVANGLVNSEIARRLHIAEETVKSHVRTLLRKLEARNRTHAVAVALRQGIIS